MNKYITILLFLGIVFVPQKVLSTNFKNNNRPKYNDYNSDNLDDYINDLIEWTCKHNKNCDKFKELNFLKHILQNNNYNELDNISDFNLFYRNNHKNSNFDNDNKNDNDDIDNNDEKTTTYSKTTIGTISSSQTIDTTSQTIDTTSQTIDTTSQTIDTIISSQDSISFSQDTTSSSQTKDTTNQITDTTSSSQITDTTSSSQTIDTTSSSQTIDTTSSSQDTISSSQDTISSSQTIDTTNQITDTTSQNTDTTSSSQYITQFNNTNISSSFSTKNSSVSLFITGIILLTTLISTILILVIRKLKKNNTESYINVITDNIEYSSDDNIVYDNINCEEHKCLNPIFSNHNEQNLNNKNDYTETHNYEEPVINTTYNLEYYKLDDDKHYYEEPIINTTYDLASSNKITEDIIYDLANPK